MSTQGYTKYTLCLYDGNHKMDYFVLLHDYDFILYDMYYSHT